MNDENQTQKNTQNLKEAIMWNCIYLLGLLVFCCAIILHTTNIIIHIPVMNFGVTGIFDEKKIKKLAI